MLVYPFSSFVLPTLAFHRLFVNKVLRIDFYDIYLLSK